MIKVNRDGHYFLGWLGGIRARHTNTIGGLNLTYGTDGSYDGLDRFGRVVDQKWENDSATAKDRFQYTYDRSSNRLTRDLSLTGGLDEKYAYDGLNRLSGFERGTLADGSITSKVRAAAWGLSQTGNWSGYRLDANGDGDYSDTGSEEIDQDEPRAVGCRL